MVDERRAQAVSELRARIAHLCAPANEGDAGHARRRVALLVDGLRFRALSLEAKAAAS